MSNSVPPRSAAQQSVPVDFALLRRVQQHNQEQIVGKLLHDLRNPVHSMQITVELFERLALGDGDTSALLRRAARYVGPARTGLESLVLQTQRLATWLSPAVRQPSLQPVAVNSWLAEIVSLSRDSTRALEIEMESALTDEVRLAADLSRLSQALLRWMLTHAASPAVLKARGYGPDRIEIAVRYAAPAADAGAAPFTRAEFDALIENAGGELTGAADSAGIMLSFARVH